MNFRPRCHDCGCEIAEDDYEARVYQWHADSRGVFRHACSACVFAHRWTRQLARVLGR
jgi:protocatechuate 3,4-dioxygenase beta subunit